MHRDPLELRRCWYSKHPLHLKLLDWAMALPAWAQRGPVASTSGRFRRGIGVAAAAWPFTYNAFTKVEVSTTPDGLLARCATQDSGSGTRTVLAQAVAEVFALPSGDVLVQIGDSSAPLGPGSFASQVTNSVYGPAHDAATEVRDHLLEAARTELRLSNVQAVADGIKHAGGFMSWHMLLQQTQPYTAVQERHAERGPLGIPLRLPGDENSPTPGFRQAHALTLVEVEVDTLLGKIRPLHAWTGIAAGKIFVPALARSQVYGAVIQGLGYALYEAREVDLATGRNLTVNLEAYKLPGIGDTPEIEVHFVEEGFEKVRGQGIGMSELATVGVTAAVGNAVFHATW